VLIYHHIFVQLTNVTIGEFVYMRAIELPDGCAVQSVNVAAAMSCGERERVSLQEKGKKS